MHDNPRTLTALDNVMDSAVLDLLTAERHPIWSVEEVERELGRPSAYDSIVRLHGAGLIHRLGADDGFVVVSRAGQRGREIAED